MPSIINATTTNGVAISPDNSGSLQLATNNGTTAVTIDTSQNVGIGTSTPQNGAGYGGLTLNGSTGGQLSFFTGGTLRSTIFNDSTNLYLFNATATGVVTVSTNSAERMRITSGGDLLVGTTSYTDARIISNGISGAYSYRSNAASTAGAYYHMTFNPAGGTQSGFIYSPNTTSTIYATSSDYRLKENIAPMTGAIDKILQLKPCTYTWKSTGDSSQGFIAHELQAVVPDCVTGEKDAVDKDGNPVYQGVDTSFLVATLTAAIQELKAELDATKAEVQLLKNPPVEGTE